MTKYVIEALVILVLVLGALAAALHGTSRQHTPAASGRPARRGSTRPVPAGSSPAGVPACSPAGDCQTRTVLRL